MDGDLSHDPRYIPALLEATGRYDVVLGSRFVRGGSDTDRALWRRVLTRRRELRSSASSSASAVRDANSGYRCFRRAALRRDRAREPRVARAGDRAGGAVPRPPRGLRVGEIPVVFAERARGDSKLGWGELWQGYVTVLRLRARDSCWALES